MQKVSYMGNGTTTEFTFNFPYYENSNIIVTKNNQTATGYDIIGTSGGVDADIPYIGGKVVFETAPSSLDNITIARQLPLTRTVDYQPTEKIDPTTLNQDMNYLMEVLKDRKDEIDTLNNQYSDIADKESTTTLLARITAIGEDIAAVNQTITDFNTAIENGRIMSKDKFFSYVTNCLTAIPQDIKLELNNGTLTLKSGSKLYIPNGSVVNTTSDITITASSTLTRLLFINATGTTADYINETLCYSGASAPTVSGTARWFDTANLVIKQTTDSGATWTTLDTSLPIAVFTTNNGSIVSYKAFNGFGYIGSTIFALPGVSGLIPNGRNTDGTLKNTEFTTNTVLYKNVSGNATDKPVGLKNDNINPATITYNQDTNYNSSSLYCICGKISITNDKITSFEIKKVFNLI